MAGRGVLRTMGDKDGRSYVGFHCPGCQVMHMVCIKGPVAWTFNGDYDRPTFEPSIKVTWPANPAALDDFKEWRNARCCHSHVRDGIIEFLSDCTHNLAGQKVPLSPP